jgi:hypothetical protein
VRDGLQHTITGHSVHIGAHTMKTHFKYIIFKNTCSNTGGKQRISPNDEKKQVGNYPQDISSTD